MTSNVQLKLLSSNQVKHIDLAIDTSQHMWCKMQRSMILYNAPITPRDNVLFTCISRCELFPRCINTTTVRNNNKNSRFSSAELLL